MDYGRLISTLEAFGYKVGHEQDTYMPYLEMDGVKAYFSWDSIDEFMMAMAIKRLMRVHKDQRKIWEHIKKTDEKQE